MHVQKSGQLRNASEKRGAEIRKKDLLELKEFLKEWRLRLLREGMEWDGRKAVAELQRKKMFEFLLCEKTSEIEWQAEDLFDRILDEMKSYVEEVRDGLAKVYFDKIDGFLRGVKASIQKREEGAGVPGLKSLLSDLGKEVERTQKAVERLKQQKRDWHSGVWQYAWPEVRRKNFVSGKIELDTRLQVELGKKFADYLRPEGVSLETIARLVLLACLVGGLADLDAAGARMHATGRVLTVRKIRDKLRYAGLHKAKSFRSRQTRKRRLRSRKVKV